MKDNPLPEPPTFLPGVPLKILRTIDTFQPNYQIPAQQAWQISNRLEQMGIRSPIVTTVDSGRDRSTIKETLDQVQVIRVPVQFSLGRYRVSMGMMTYLRSYHLIHSHLYRTFQSDCSFFLRGSGKNLLY